MHAHLRKCCVRPAGAAAHRERGAPHGGLHFCARPVADAVARRRRPRVQRGARAAAAGQQRCAGCLPRLGGAQAPRGGGGGRGSGAGARGAHVVHARGGQGMRSQEGLRWVLLAWHLARHAPRLNAHARAAHAPAMQDAGLAACTFKPAIRPLPAFMAALNQVGYTARFLEERVSGCCCCCGRGASSSPCRCGAMAAAAHCRRAPGSCGQLEARAAGQLQVLQRPMSAPAAGRAALTKERCAGLSQSQRARVLAVMQRQRQQS